MKKSIENKRHTYIKPNATANLEYNKNGDIKKIIQPNGDVSKYVYDNVGLLTNISYMSKEGQRLTKSLSYDPAGNIVSSVQTGSKPSYSRTKAYNYDKVNQLISYTEDGAIENYVYDGRGNRIRKTSSSGIETEYEYNSLNQMVSKSVGDTQHRYAYDKRGNLKSE